VAGKEKLIAEVARTEALLSDLKAQEEQARARLAALRAELAAQGQAEPGIRVYLPETLPQPVPRSPEEKVSLFRQLFRGRADVFPTRFVSRKTGKPGYAPACTNEFVRGVCELPKVKCGECPNQAFVPVDDATVLAHLQGREVMGAYPLLKDETCWFLAVDFDFADRLQKFARHLVVLHGSMTARGRNAARDQLAAIPSDQERLVLATGRYVGEGFDDARLDTLFLALPVSWKGTLVQYTGRLHPPRQDRGPDLRLR
jgi:hypothetical protein